MASELPQHLPPPYSKTPPAREQDEWEDWEDDDGVTPIDAGEQVLIHGPHPPAPARCVSVRAPTHVVPRSRVSVVKIKRKSQHRQKAQNAKAGIKVITDMSAFRRPNNAAQRIRSPDGRPVKFVDAAALRALEGEPSSASVGNWNWFKKNKSQSPATPSPLQPATARSPDQIISPEDRPIIIGISLPSDEYAGSNISPPTATPHDLETPIEPRPTLQIPSNASTQPPQTTQPSQSAPTPTVQKSVWSPDTPDTAISWGSSRATSSIYSQLPPALVGPSGDVPPVPAVPENFKKKSHHQRLISIEVGNGADEDDIDTPCTLFEEDGVSSPKKSKGKGSVLTPDSAGSRSHGWWDHHVVTPFMDKRLTFTRKAKLESPKEDHEDEWWSKSVPEQTKTQYLSPNPQPKPFQTPIVKAPTPPRRTLSNRSDTTAVDESGPSTARSSPTLQGSPMREKAELIVTPKIIVEQPPPYSPPKKQKKKENPLVRYRAVFPPGHPLQAQFPPSPGPVSPGLSNTMTSQGGTQMTEIPLTPASTIPTRSPLSQIALPARPVGTFLPQEHSHEERGEMTQSERERRRHEKEEVVARKMGGFWRGRGCLPKKGCFGRTGPEGRKRRRIWLAVLIVILLLIALVVTLAVVLTRHHERKEQPSIWVNLTDYPPMPTGILSVVGPDNTVSRSGCTEPSTLWSCSLPKELHDSVAPYRANQPTIVMNIQYDNNTRETWKVPNGDPPVPVSRRNVGSAVGASSLIQERQANDLFTPDPSPPDFQEMWFLGNTTDDVQSDDKGGEPTPFYISLLESSAAADASKLEKRQDSGNVSIPDILPSPDLNEDGTPKPAVMLPQPVQQPVRLYDRGLPTEHYGFYTYFKRTLYLKSVTVVDQKDEDIPLDEDGGCKETEANFITTWSETRLLVQIWTNSLNANTSTLLSSAGQGTINGTKELIRPGTMPWPVTVTLDTHGGNPAKKFVWEWPIDNRQQLDLTKPKLLANDIGVAGTWINKRSKGDAKFGGFDGGTGGCKCEWVNWVTVRSS